jgi:co-chaperonin GroES (HSP10)
MFPIKDTFFVSGDKDLNRKLPIKDANGNYMYLDADFNPYYYSTRIANIRFTPKIIGDEFIYDTELKADDSVLCHHFVLQDDNAITYGEETLYRADYFHIFAKVESETITPLEDFIFVKPIIVEPTFMGNIQISFESEVKQGCGVVEFLGNNAKKAGLQVGDKVYYLRSAQYKIDFCGVEYFRMRTRNVLMVERDGALITFKNKVLLKMVSEKEEIFKVEKRTSIGIVTDINGGYDCLSVGHTVNYTKGLSLEINREGNDYILIDKKDINYIL